MVLAVRSGTGPPIETKASPSPWRIPLSVYSSIHGERGRLHCHRLGPPTCLVWDRSSAVSGRPSVGSVRPSGNASLPTPGRDDDDLRNHCPSSSAVVHTQWLIIWPRRVSPGECSVPQWLNPSLTHSLAHWLDRMIIHTEYSQRMVVVVVVMAVMLHHPKWIDSEDKLGGASTAVARYSGPRTTRCSTRAWLWLIMQKSNLYCSIN